VKKQPDVVLLDINLGNETSLDFLPQLLSASASARVLIVTGVTDPEAHMRAVRLGAIGIVRKVETPDVLLSAIHKVYDGELQLPGHMVAGVLAELTLPKKARPIDPEAARIARLTAREREVVGLIGEGHGTKAMASRLFISEPTIRHYVASIFDKLGVSDRVELVVYAYEHGLAQMPRRRNRDQQVSQVTAD
jgi:two-component system, NarL family, nitrate/nitrite response regulator NarL